MLEHDLSNLKTSPLKKLPADYEEIKEVSEYRSTVIQVLCVCASFTCGAVRMEVCCFTGTKVSALLVQKYLRLHAENVSMLHALFFVRGVCQHPPCSFTGTKVLALLVQSTYIRACLTGTNVLALLVQKYLGLSYLSSFL
jgi:glutaredoxin-related protein